MLVSYHQDITVIRRDRKRQLPVRFVACNVARGSTTINGHAVDVLRAGPSRREKDPAAVRSPGERKDVVGRRQSPPKVAPKLVQPKIPSSVVVCDYRELCTVWRQRQ